MFKLKGVIESNICLLPMIGKRENNLIKLYGFFKQGFLLNGGGLSDQPNAFFESMDIIDNYSNKLWKEKEKDLVKGR